MKTEWCTLEKSHEAPTGKGTGCGMEVLIYLSGQVSAQLETKVLIMWQHSTQWHCSPQIWHTVGCCLPSQRPSPMRAESMPHLQNLLALRVGSQQEVAFLNTASLFLSMLRLTALETLEREMAWFGKADMVFVFRS